MNYKLWIIIIASFLAIGIGIASAVPDVASKNIQSSISKISWGNVQCNGDICRFNITLEKEVNGQMHSVIIEKKFLQPKEEKDIEVARDKAVEQIANLYSVKPLVEETWVSKLIGGFYDFIRRTFG